MVPPAGQEKDCDARKKKKILTGDFLIFRIKLLLELRERKKAQIVRLAALASRNIIAPDVAANRLFDVLSYCKS